MSGRTHYLRCGSRLKVNDLSGENFYLGECFVKLISMLRSRKMLALLMLGFASGLPAAQADGLLPLWLKDQQFADKAVTPILALAGIPIAFKFLWSPLVDRFVPPFLGRRRGWLIITQIILLVLLSTLAIQHPDSKDIGLYFEVTGFTFFKLRIDPFIINLTFFKALVLLIGFVSATQDIAADAYRTEALPDQAEKATGAALWTNGFRISYLLAGSLLVLLVKPLTWNGVYFLVAGMMLIGIAASWFAPEPAHNEKPPASFVDAVVLPFREFFNRKGLIDAIAILVFILVYKLGDNLARIGGKLYFKKIGFSNEIIGTQTAIATISAMMGALFGAWIILKVGLNRALWIGILLLAVGISPYLLMVGNGTASLPLLALSVNAEYFFGGTEAAVFVAFLMNLCNSRFTATQYALFSGIVFLGRSIVIWYSGAVIEAVGYQNFFWLCIASTIPGLLLLTYIAPWNKTDSDLPA
jgi:MFS transporter, PAT family, beta-lactamase induction signal transducer AmpG